MARILVVDDETAFRDLVRDILVEAGYEVVEADDGERALARLSEEPVTLVLTDWRMPRLDGIELLRRVRMLPVPPPVVVLTAFGSIPDAVSAVRLGAADYLTKPLPSPAVLLAVVRRILGASDKQEEFVTVDPRLRERLALVDRVAARDVPVLVLGESGTGKELIALRLHAGSRRARSAFVAVNCASLPESLAESELFGHEKGAFTGADRLRKGRFEEAHGGTLFLDEAADLSPAMQAKLLRAIEEKTIRRVGGALDTPADVRLVAATNRDLARDVEEGRFRRDLYFRIAVVTVSLPPLRERPGDIEPLTRHLIGRLAERHGIPLAEITAEALGALARHAWPGNVRELRNVLERALVVRGGAPIRTEDLALAEAPESAGLARAASIPLGREEWERESLLEALRKSGGNRSRAAALLGVSPRTLYYRLKKLKLT